MKHNLENAYHIPSIREHVNQYVNMVELGSKSDTLTPQKIKRLISKHSFSVFQNKKIFQHKSLREMLNVYAPIYTANSKVIHR